MPRHDEELDKLFKAIKDGKLNDVIKFFEDKNKQNKRKDTLNKRGSVYAPSYFYSQNDRGVLQHIPPCYKQHFYFKEPYTAPTKAFNGTLLHLAIAYDRKDIANYLLEQGADIEAVTAPGVQPIYQAENEESIALTPLHLAVLNGREEIVDLLLNKNAKVNAISPPDFNVLHIAAGFAKADSSRTTYDYKDKFSRILLKLLQHGADFRQQDKYGNTPLKVASTHPASRQAMLTIYLEYYLTTIRVGKANHAILQEMLDNNLSIDELANLFAIIENKRIYDYELLQQAQAKCYQEILIRHNKSQLNLLKAALICLLTVILLPVTLILLAVYAYRERNVAVKMHTFKKSDLEAYKKIKPTQELKAFSSVKQQSVLKTTQPQNENMTLALRKVLVAHSNEIPGEPVFYGDVTSISQQLNSKSAKVHVLYTPANTKFEAKIETLNSIKNKL